jgi:N-methylhydantoinase B
VRIYRNDGSVEKYDMCTRIRVIKGELIRLTTATGGGYGNPATRPRGDIARDLKNGFVTKEQVARDYGIVVDSA